MDPDQFRRSELESNLGRITDNNNNYFSDTDERLNEDRVQPMNKIFVSTEHLRVQNFEPPAANHIDHSKVKPKWNLKNPFLTQDEQPKRYCFNNKNLLIEGCNLSSMISQDGLNIRRSSHTITRQSSFWLEDTTSDSSASSNVCVLDALGSNETEAHSSNINATYRECSVQSQNQLDTHQLENLPIQESSLKYTTDEASTSREVDQPQSGNSPSSLIKHSKIKTPSLQRNNRLSSSSSTSTTTSSPSPDFSRPSERIFSLASRSSCTISKSRIFSRLQTRRQYQRHILSNSYERTMGSFGLFRAKKQLTHQHKSEPGPTATRPLNLTSVVDRPQSNISASNNTLKESKDEEKDSESPIIDRDFLKMPTDRPISDRNSASLERQCRDLWKLRATLHSDASVGDNWHNYHQRLNRRYDSGYKSIENQFSISIEGSTATMAPANIAQSFVRNQSLASGQEIDLTSSKDETKIWQKNEQQAVGETIAYPRPQSGCSGYIAAKPIEEIIPNDDDTIPLISDAVDYDYDDDLEREISLTQSCDDMPNIVNSKLADLELDETPIDLYLQLTEERDCQSRSSKGSQENGTNKNNI